MEEMEGERPGFFKAYHVRVLQQLTAPNLEAFGSLTSDQERFRFVWSLSIIHASQARQDTTTKSLSEATAARKSGNQCFQGTLYSQALAHYSESIRKAPFPTSLIQCMASNSNSGSKEEQNEALSLALANRSAALFHLCRYQEALQDTFHAQESGYPVRLLCKLLQRRAQCYAFLGQKDSARETISQAEELALQHLSNAPPQLIRAKFLAELAKAKMDLDHVYTEPAAKESVMDECELSGATKGTQLPQVTSGPHPSLPSAAQVVEIKISAEAGRYAITTENLHPGDVVAVEKAYASVLQPLKYPSHCHHCFQATAALLPCPHCVSASFCSNSCRKAALTSYHATECQLLDHLFQAGISITCYLALRIVTQSPLDYFRQLKPYLSDTCTTTAPPKPGNGYLRIYDLVSHCDKRSARDFFHQTVMATFLLKCLRAVGYFTPSGSSNTPGPMDDPLDHAGEFNEDTELIGAILLRNLQVMQFNAHEVAELQLLRPGSLEGAKSVFLGAAVFPTVAMFNHSCNPGIVRYFVGDTMIARAIRGHVAGEILAENYGPIFTQTVREERQATLKSRYWFDCGCEACLNNWPLYTQMTDQTWQFRCTTPNCATALPVSTETLSPFVRCRRCRNQTNILKGLKTLQETEQAFQHGNQLMAEYRVPEALQIFLSTLSKLESVLCPPFKDFHLTQEATRKCMLSQGNLRVVPT